jgi:hypothetical protein
MTHYYMLKAKRARLHASRQRAALARPVLIAAD